MAMSIRNPKAERLARRLADASGVTMTEAIIQALEDKLRKLEIAPVDDADFAALMNISRRCAGLPVVDARTEDEILGYSKEGV